MGLDPTGSQGKSFEVGKTAQRFLTPNSPWEFPQSSLAKATLSSARGPAVATKGHPEPGGDRGAEPGKFLLSLKPSQSTQSLTLLLRKFCTLVVSSAVFTIA